MEVTLLCIGDVVGKPGRSVVSQAIPRLVKERGVDCVIANVENAAAGSGLTEMLYNKFVRYGVHLMTMGDHIYRKAEIMPVLERSDRIVRPANYPDEAVGKEYAIHQTPGGIKIAVFSLMGRLFMNPPSNCAFHAADRMLERISKLANVIVVDMHAEATSEKVAMGWHLAGRVSVVFGTHTHIPTADECILDGGTAYVTDLGMSGPYDSVLGRRKDRVLKAMLTGLPTPFDVAVGDARMCGILVRVDAQTGRARHVERVCIKSSGLVAEEGDDD